MTNDALVGEDTIDLMVDVNICCVCVVVWLRLPGFEKTSPPKLVVVRVL